MDTIKGNNLIVLEINRIIQNINDLYAELLRLGIAVDEENNSDDLPLKIALIKIISTFDQTPNNVSYDAEYKSANLFGEGLVDATDTFVLWSTLYTHGKVVDDTLFLDKAVVNGDTLFLNGKD